MMLWRNTHRRFRERLSAYLDGELSPDGARALQAHLDSCDTCAAEFADLRMTSAALAELPEVEVPRSFALTPDLVGRAAAQANGARSASTGFRLAGGALAAALAVVLVLDAGGIVGNGSGGPAGGGDESPQAAYDMTSNAAASPPEKDDSTSEMGGVEPTGRAVSSPGAAAGDGEERAAETPTPAATEIPGDAAAGLGLNGRNNDDNETLAIEDLNDDSGDGLSALTVTEIVLAALLGASIIGSVAATYAARRRG